MGTSETQQNCTCEGAFCIERPQSFPQIFEGSVHTSKLLRNTVWGVPVSCIIQIRDGDLGHHLLRSLVPPLTHFMVLGKSFNSSESQFPHT